MGLKSTELEYWGGQGKSRDMRGLELGLVR